MRRIGLVVALSAPEGAAGDPRGTPLPM